MDECVRMCPLPFNLRSLERVAIEPGAEAARDQNLTDTHDRLDTALASATKAGQARSEPPELALRPPKRRASTQEEQQLME